MDSRKLPSARESGLPIAAGGDNLEPLSPALLSQDTQFSLLICPACSLIYCGRPES